jgi:cephalosporin-C deacetylase-like acetyl esterase
MKRSLFAKRPAAVTLTLGFVLATATYLTGWGLRPGVSWGQPPAPAAAEVTGEDAAGKSNEKVVADSLGLIPDKAANRRRLDEYFRSSSERLTQRSLADVITAEDWEARRGEYRRQLAEMLGLDPMPPRTPLQAQVTGTIEDHGVVVEKIHFQSMPGLYVTANLYRPPKVDKPLPTILYVCGHARAVADGVSLGGKTSYHHHGVWFARNGYVCMVIDTIQLGEIEGKHHGTYQYGMWWWNSRGYTPAGVEAWNGIRALDYLETRPEVDAKRFGITGRSGGGAYSWWVAALDDRIAAAVPVAGITSLNNHVIDGCVEGHCDCMYMVNTYRWDFPMVAALVAPRPLLISNTDKDRIFPLEGVVDVHAKARRIYRLLGADDRLGLQITEGPHKDTQELHLHAFRWFNRFLRDTDELIRIPAEKVFEPKALRVFDKLPEDERVTTIHETFVPAKDAMEFPGSIAQSRRMHEEVTRQLIAKTYGGWPSEVGMLPLAVTTGDAITSDDGTVTLRRVEFDSEPGVRLPAFLIESQDGKNAAGLIVLVADRKTWPAIESELRWRFAPQAQRDSLPPRVTEGNVLWELIAGGHNEPIAVVVPRGIGPTDWGGDDRARTQARRRYMLLGQTEAGMQVWDVRRAISALLQRDGWQGTEVGLVGEGDAAVIALHAGTLDPRVLGMRLNDPPAENRDGPDLLNVSRIVELPALVVMNASAEKRIVIVPTEATKKRWQDVAAHYQQLDGAKADSISVR